MTAYDRATASALIAKRAGAKPPEERATSDPRRNLNFTAKGTPRLSASSGKAVREPPPKPTKERDQGKGRGTGINKGMVKESIPQVVMRNTQGIPTSRQKM